MAKTGIEKAFLDDIIANPDDNAARLIYADWLDEQGKEARAEFIRAQCEMANLPTYTPQYRQLDRRAEELWELHKGAWSEEAPVVNGKPLEVWYSNFQRGFLHSVELGMKAFIQHGEALLTDSTIRGVHIMDSAGVLNASEVQACRAWEKLKELHFTGSQESAGQHALAAVRAAVNLQALTISGDYTHMTDDDIRDLVRFPHCEKLRHLSLENQLLGIGLIPLAKNKKLSSLHSLNLTGNILDNHVSPAFFKKSSYKLGQLEEFIVGITNNLMKKDNLMDLLQTNANNLKSLIVKHDESDPLNAIKDTKASLALVNLTITCTLVRELVDLANATNLPQLEHINFEGTEIKNKTTHEKSFLTELFTARKQGIAALPKLAYIDDASITELARTYGLDYVAAPEPAADPRRRIGEGRKNKRIADIPPTKLPR